MSDGLRKVSDGLVKVSDVHNVHNVHIVQIVPIVHIVHIVHIADLQISKCPIGPTKNLERLYNRVVGRLFVRLQRWL